MAGWEFLPDNLRDFADNLGVEGIPGSPFGDFAEQFSLAPEPGIIATFDISSDVSMKEEEDDDTAKREDKRAPE